MGHWMGTFNEPFNHNEFFWKAVWLSFSAVNLCSYTQHYDIGKECTGMTTWSSQSTLFKRGEVLYISLLQWKCSLPCWMACLQNATWIMNMGLSGLKQEEDTRSAHPKPEAFSTHGQLGNAIWDQAGSGESKWFVVYRCFNRNQSLFCLKSCNFCNK